MTDSAKLTQLQNMGDDDSTLLDACLAFAKEKILAKRFPFGDGTEEFPEEYDQLHIQLTHYLYLRSGAEGEIVHLENGISRHWEDGDAPATLMRQVTPKGGVL